jgi:hypothetical protein
MHQKRLEIEMLLDDIHKLEDNKKVITTDTLQAELLAEAGKKRGTYSSTILTPRLKEAAKQLKNLKDVTIRKADKTAAYVLIPTHEYMNKISDILSDDSKFQRITRNPVEDLKRKVNKTITAINAKKGSVHFNKLQGDYGLGYAYGNVKTHKPGNPLRPIISQIPTPTYHLAKKLNELLTPYTPSKFSLQSSADFLELIKSTQPDGIIASLDVESLFTNVPVDTTIGMILDRVYRDESTPKLDIPEPHLKSLLEACTKEAPFISPQGDMYLQIDGVAMGSPLGVLFANFYMGTIEDRVFSSRQKPTVYCRYVDDIFVIVKDSDELIDLKRHLERESVLRFTHENSENNSLPFLDVLITKTGTSLSTNVYTKPTNIGLCLNGRSECPQRYKASVLNAYIRRALTHCSEWSNVSREFERVTQVLVNNGYSNAEINAAIRRHLDRWYNSEPRTETTTPPIKLYYKSTMHSEHIKEERIMKEIIRKGVKSTTPNQNINLIIFYKTKKTSELLIKNSPKPTENPLQQSSVVYMYTCPHEGCNLQCKYIGMTSTKLTRRLTCHLQSGAPRNHMRQAHDITLTREMLNKNTCIIDKTQDSRRLQILEAIHIRIERPTMNTQITELFTLPTMRVRTRQEHIDANTEDNVQHNRPITLD